MYNAVKRHGGEIGRDCSSIAVNWAKRMDRKGQVVDRRVGGVGALLKARGVRVVKGTAKLLGPKEALVESAEGGTEKIPAHAVILASGSVPALPPVPGFDLPGVITSDEALSLEKPPKSLLIVGGGVIGIEMASIFAPLGTEVTVVEMLPDILPNGDEEIAALMRELLKNSNIEVRVGAMVKNVVQAGTELKVEVGGS